MTIRRPLRPVRVLGCLLLVAVPPAAAQKVAQSWCAQAPGSHFGFAVDGVGDVDGDGVADVAVAEADHGAVPGFTGQTHVLSGLTGATLFSFAGQGYDVAGIGDVDADGVPDVAASVPLFSGPLGSVEVRSGADGSLIHHVPEPVGLQTFGWSVDGTGDVDGDGVPDVVVGAPGADLPDLANVGVVLVLSGADAGIVLQVQGSVYGATAGTRVRGLGDVDGDGLGDVAFDDRVPAAVPVGSILAVRVVSGASGATLLEISDPALEFTTGLAFDAVDDMDGDGARDVVIGVATASGGFLRVVSSADGGALLEVPGAWIGASGVGDVNGDGVPDIAAQTENHVVRVHSGADGSVLHELAGAPGFGGVIAGLGDLDGDGLSELLIGAPNTAAGTVPGATGCAYLVSSRPPVLTGIVPGVVQAAAAFGGQVTIDGDDFTFVDQVSVGTKVLTVEGGGVTPAGSGQLVVSVPVPDALGPHDVVVSGGQGTPSDPITLSYVETHPPVLAGPAAAAGTGQTVAWGWYGGPGDVAAFLVASNAFTIQVKGWALLRDHLVVAFAPLDAVGGGGTLPAVIPPGLAGLIVYSQVATLDGGLVGTSNIETMLIGF